MRGGTLTSQMINFAEETSRITSSFLSVLHQWRRCRCADNQSINSSVPVQQTGMVLLYIVQTYMNDRKLKYQLIQLHISVVWSMHPGEGGYPFQTFAVCKVHHELMEVHHFHKKSARVDACGKPFMKITQSHQTKPGFEKYLLEVQGKWWDVGHTWPEGTTERNVHRRIFFYSHQFNNNKENHWKK